MFIYALLIMAGVVTGGAVAWHFCRRQSRDMMEGDIKFEKRAVAFIDVLGFKSVVDSANSEQSALSELTELIELLATAVPTLDSTVSSTVPEELVPKHIYISDCIILSAPLTSEKKKSYNGLAILVMRVIQLTHMLLNKGYIIRGGISVGNVWHIKTNIVGVAYQEAYSIERKVIVPCVQLSESAQEYWNKTEGADNKMCLNYKGKFIVNGLHDYYIEDKSHGAVEDAFRRYRQIIDKNINDSPSESVRYKWWWFGQFLESEIQRNAFIPSA